jgi:hypothetical protein
VANGTVVTVYCSVDLTMLTVVTHTAQLTVVAMMSGSGDSVDSGGSGDMTVVMVTVSCDRQRRQWYQR